MLDEFGNQKIMDCFAAVYAASPAASSPYVLLISMTSIT